MDSSVIAARYLLGRNKQSFGSFDFIKYEDIMKAARTAIGKKRQISKGVFAAIRSGKNRIVFIDDAIKIG